MLINHKELAAARDSHVWVQEKDDATVYRALQRALSEKVNFSRDWKTVRNGDLQMPEGRAYEQRCSAAQEDRGVFYFEKFIENKGPNCYYMPIEVRYQVLLFVAPKHLL